MRKLVGVFILVLVLCSQTALAGYQVECRADTILVRLQPGDPGKAFKAEDFQKVISPEFQAQLDSVNIFQRRLVVEVSNDPTLWKFWQFAQSDPQYAGLDFESLNLVFDAAVNYARRQNTVNQILAWIGVNQDAIIADRPIRRGQCFIKIYGAKLLPYQEQNMVKPEVARAATDTTVINNYNYNYHVAPGLAFGLHGGMSYVMKPHATYSLPFTLDISLLYRQRLMVQAYGLNSLFLRKDRDTALGQLSTFDQGGGLLIGTRLQNPLWLTVGYFNQETVLDEVQAGKNVNYFRGFEGGVQLIKKRYILSATVLYGHRQDLGNTLTTDLGARIALTVGNIWGVK